MANSEALGWFSLWGRNDKKEEDAVIMEEGDNKKLQKEENDTSREAFLATTGPEADARDTETRQSLKRSSNASNKDAAENKRTKQRANSSYSIHAATSWLNWLGRGRSVALDSGDESQGNEGVPDPHKQEPADDTEDDNLSLEENGDEIEDVMHGASGKDRIQKKSSTWTFWNGTNNNKSNSSNNSVLSLSEKGTKDNTQRHNSKEKLKENLKLTNTLLQSDTSFPSKKALHDLSMKTRTANTKEMSPPSSSEQDDSAILYKPHDKSSQFNKINTHKNENLRENVIVPDWELCLPEKTSIVSDSIFGNTATSSSNKSEFINWKKILSQVSSKLGFNPSTLTSENEPSVKSRAKKGDLHESHLLESLNDRHYGLYGECLRKLPQTKRACLPNYDKFYLEDNSVSQSPANEEPADDPNLISVSNDLLGNLLINEGLYNEQPGILKSSDIVSRKAGPLKKIKKILIIGVHGFFPTRMIRPLIGSPKGTSSKFANEAEKAMIRYCFENNLIDENENDVRIQKIALEKEGKIFDRVRFFTDILEKWKAELNDADFIFIAAHSQGCVVSIILLSQLIKKGILENPLRKRIGILCMAGVNNGPFYGVDKSLFMKAYSAIEHESLLELFELTKFSSPQSLVYKDSIQTIIRCNVKVCLIGSINDQLVPLYSALASHVYHPNIYRACYIDHSSQTPLFIQKLVSICCQLQNLGYFDNNVLKELSTALAGPLTGGGHSKIYNDGKVYDLGIKFVLDTEDIIVAPSNAYSSNDETLNTNNAFASSVIKSLPPANIVYLREFNISKVGTNAFVLPWCLRGLIFNIEKNWPNNNKLISVSHGSEIGRNGYDEIKELYELFESWKPETKILKDLKFRLSGLRLSKL